MPVAETEDAEAIRAYLDEINGHDPDEGTVPHRVMRFLRYRRCWWPLESLCPQDLQEPVSAAVVARYAAQPAFGAPPIVVDGADRSIVDGFHRYHAAKVRGDTHVLAYVGEQPRPGWRPGSPPGARLPPSAPTVPACVRKPRA